jgi:hypothetical protein
MSILQTSALPKALAEALSKSDMYLYLEYTAAGSPVVAAPTGVLADPRAYYTGLGSTLNYLRVPAIADPVRTDTSTGTPTYSTAIRFFGQSASPYVPMNSPGAAFGTNASCYGAALVLARDPADATKDLVLARSYFVADQLVKSDSSEIFVTFTFSSTAS